jgi:hypothetical protein
VPHIDDGPGQRFAVHVQHLAFEQHWLAQVEAIVQPSFAFAQRRASHVQRAFDGARCTAGIAGLAIAGIAEQVEEVLQAKPAISRPASLRPPRRLR